MGTAGILLALACREWASRGRGQWRIMVVMGTAGIFLPLACREGGGQGQWTNKGGWGTGRVAICCVSNGRKGLTLSAPKLCRGPRGAPQDYKTCCVHTPNRFGWNLA